MQIENKEGLVLNRQITADDIDRIVNHRVELVNRWKAAALLGGSDAAFRQLRLEGRVRQHTDGIDRRPMFDPREVEAFLSQVLCAVPATKKTPTDLVSLPKASSAIGTALVGAADLVRDGKIRSARRVPIGIGLEQIVVDVEDLREVIKSEMQPALPKLQAAAHLRTSLRTIDHLIRENHLELIKRGLSLKGHDFPAVSERCITGFLEEHTTVGRIAAGMGLSFMYVMHAFDRCGVEAVRVPKGSCSASRRRPKAFNDLALCHFKVGDFATRLHCQRFDRGEVVRFRSLAP